MNNSARPIPQFVKSDPLFLSKKSLRSTPKKIPPRPPSKSSLPISRFSSHSSLNRAQAVSFKYNSDSSSLSKHYDETSAESYFDQCFQVFEKIGSGFFGDVFKVKSKEDGMFYAVKKFRERFKGKSDRRRKLEEVAKHEQLPKHLNLVRFYKAWEENHYLYIQTELCETSLTDFLEVNHDVDEHLVWNYLIDLLFAVKHLHDHNLIHLDIKPDNIFITKDGICKLGDFGLVVDLSKGDTSEATEGDPKYLAKELMQGKFSKAADIFSLGLTTLELACDLELPSGGQGWHQLRSGDIPTEFFNNLSCDLRRVIQDMMNPNFEERPTAEQLLTYPVINKLSRKRKFQLKYKSYFSSITQNVYKFFYYVFKVFLLSYVCEWFKTKLLFNSTKCLKTPPHHNCITRISSTEKDNSFSDDDVFESSFASDGFSNSSDDRSVNNSINQVSKRVRRECFSGSTSNHRFLDSTLFLTPIRKESPLLHEKASFKDNFTINKSSCSQRLSFCDVSDDEDDILNESMSSSIGPKNLLSVFEEIESEEKMSDDLCH